MSKHLLRISRMERCHLCPTFIEQPKHVYGMHIKRAPPAIFTVWCTNLFMEESKGSIAWRYRIL